MIAAISLGLILKFILLGELTIFGVWAILSLVCCFIEWYCFVELPWRYILSIDRLDVCMGILCGVLLGVIEMLLYFMFNIVL